MRPDHWLNLNLGIPALSAARFEVLTETIPGLTLAAIAFYLVLPFTVASSFRLKITTSESSFTRLKCFSENVSLG
jgi:hypothetical protein